MKRTATILLAALLLFSGCAGRDGPAVSVSEAGGSAGTQGNIPLGRYLEQSWSLPEVNDPKAYLSKIQTAENGYDVLMVGNSPKKLSLWHTVDGASWENRDAALLDQIELSETTIPMGADWDSSGTISVLTVTNGEPPGITLQRSKSASEWETVPADWTDLKAESGSRLEKPINPQSLTVGQDGSYFIRDAFSDKVCRYSPDGTFQNIYPSDRSNFVILPDRIAVCNLSENVLLFYDLETEEETGRVPLDSGVLANKSHRLMLTGGKDGSLYAMSPNGIFHLVPGGGLMERMVDGASCTLSMPSLYFGGMAVGADGNFLVSMGDGFGDERLYHYTYDATVPARPDKTLTVAALESLPTLKQAAVVHQIEHPDVSVELRVLAGDSVPEDDAIRTLNTELLAGKGPDVLALDRLPIDSYAEKGVLANLQGSLAPLDQKEEYLQNILAAFQDGSETPAAPARFYAPLLAALPENNKKASTLSELAELAKADPGTRLFYDNSPYSLIKIFYPSCASGLASGGGALEKAALSQFLTDIRTLSENTGGEDFLAELDAILERDDPVTDEMRLKAGYSFAPVRLAYQKVTYCPLLFDGFWDFRTPYAALQMAAGDSLQPAQTTECFVPLPGISGKAFQPACILGVNASSPQAALAAQFLETALSENVQKENLYDGLAVHYPSLQKSIDTNTESVYGNQTPDGDELTAEAPPPEVQLPLVETFRTLDTPVLSDDTLLQFLLKESKPFFEGSITADQAAEAIAARTATYLTE